MANIMDVDNLSCCDTIKLFSSATVDSICCIPCCCFCGGCCGKYNAAIMKHFPKEAENIKPGFDRFGSTCYIQLLECLLMTNTCCGFCWGCCGTCTPCAKFIIRKITKVETQSNTTQPPNIQTMTS